MNSYERQGFKWSINEILSLQREFELLDWDINTISHKHKRSPNAIMYKLGEEGFANFNILYSNYYNLKSPIPHVNNCENNEEEEDRKNEEDK